jgi:hypothetical protein
MGLFGKDAEKELDILGNCPLCEAIEVTVVCQNYEWHFDGGAVKLLPSGFRLSCQRCPCIFSVNRHGAFQHHEQSLPWTPSPRALDSALPKPPDDEPKVRTRPPGATNDPLPMRFPKSR